MANLRSAATSRLFSENQGLPKNGAGTWAWSPRKCLRTPAIAAALGGAVMATPCLAQDAENDTWIRAAAYFPDIDTQVGIAPPDDPDFRTLIDFESDLALSDRDTLPSFMIGTRLSRHWILQGEFYRLKRSGETELARDIVYDGVTYPVEATVRSGFSSDVYRLSAGYSFVRNERVELGATLGIHATNFEVFLQGEAGGSQVTVDSERRSRDVLAPLPTIGLYGQFEPAPRLRVGGQGDFLSLKVGDYDGRLVNLQATVSYAATDNLRIGALYRYVDYRLDVEKDRYVGRIAYQFKGPGLFVELSF